jgi:hypothetical protein
MKLNRTLIAALVIAFALVAALVLLTAPRTLQAQENATLRAKLQSLIDSSTPFSITALNFGGLIDHSTITVTDLGDDYICLTGLQLFGATPDFTPTIVCTPFNAMNIQY